MPTMEPIRDTKKIKKILNYLGNQSPRDRLLFLFGIHTGLRVSDILPIHYDDIFYNPGKFRKHMVIRQQKVNHPRKVKISESFYEKIQKYIKKWELGENDYLFRKMLSDDQRKDGTELQLWLVNVFGLRISHVLAMQIKDIHDTYIQLKSDKPRKDIKIQLTNLLKQELYKYCKKYSLEKGDAIFFGFRKPYAPISRVRAWQILKEAANACEIPDFGTHTMRKTFGYHLYERTNHNIALVQKMLGQSTPEVTLRYIGVNQDQMDDAIIDLDLGK